MKQIDNIKFPAKMPSMVSNMYYGSQNTTILAALNSDRKDIDSYCDVTLRVDDKKFPAHKCILGKLSPFFNKMFKTEMKEKYNSAPSIEGISSEIMEIILDFLYTAAIDIVQKNVLEILKASDYLQLDELKELCSNFLSESINETNCLHYLQIAKTFNCPLLSDEAVKVTAQNFKGVAQKDDANDVARDDMLDIIKLVDQKEIGVQKLYNCVVSWVKYNYPSRKEDFIDFLKIIDFSSLPVAFIRTTVLSDLPVNASHVCKDYILNLLLDRIQKYEVKVAEKDDNLFVSSQAEAASSICSSDCERYNLLSSSDEDEGEYRQAIYHFDEDLPQLRSFAKRKHTD